MTVRERGGGEYSCVGDGQKRLKLSVPFATRSLKMGEGEYRDCLTSKDGQRR